MDDKEKKYSIEEALDRLDEISRFLEKDDISLKDALNQYTEGVKLINQCRDQLTDVEKQIIVLSKEAECDA